MTGLVTITTDASWHEPTLIAAYAYWIRWDTGKIHKYGAFKDTVANPSCAELMAITNALHALSKKNKKFDKIIINTDCMNVIHYLNNDHKLIKKYRINSALLHPIAAIYYKYKRENFPFSNIELRYVKAHREIKDPRTYVNDWCDKAAKKGLWDKVNSLTNVKEE